jgi:hypothetical protein
VDATVSAEYAVRFPVLDPHAATVAEILERTAVEVAAWVRSPDGRGWRIVSPATIRVERTRRGLDVVGVVQVERASVLRDAHARHTAGDHTDAVRAGERAYQAHRRTQRLAARRRATSGTGP